MTDGLYYRLLDKYADVIERQRQAGSCDRYYDQMACSCQVCVYQVELENIRRAFGGLLYTKHARLLLAQLDRIREFGSERVATNRTNPASR